MPALILSLIAVATLAASPARAQTTCADPSRTMGLEGPAACRVYDADPSRCSRAWAVTQSTGQAVSCFYLASSGTCQGCGPTNQAQGQCINSCVPQRPVPAANGSLLATLALMLAALGAALLHKRSRAALVLLLAMAAAGTARADEVKLSAARDTTIYELRNDYGNGAGDGLFTGVNSTGSPRRALIAFDVGRSVPAGATIKNVTFSLSLTRSHPGSTMVELHRVARAWGEGPARAASGGGVAARLLGKATPPGRIARGRR